MLERITFDTLEEYLESGGYSVFLYENVKGRSLITEYVKDNYSPEDRSLISQAYQSGMGYLISDYSIVPNTAVRGQFSVNINKFKDFDVVDEDIFKFDFDDDVSTDERTKDMESIRYMFNYHTEIKIGMRALYRNMHRFIKNEEFMSKLNFTFGYVRWNDSMGSNNILIYPKITRPEVHNKHIMPISELDKQKVDRQEAIYDIDKCLDRMLKK